MNRFLLLGWVSMGLVLAAVGQAKQAPRMVDVELAVRAPDGKPAAHASIVLKVRGRAHFDPKIDDITAETGDQGIARFKTPEGVYRFFVTARGIGSGQIGTYEFVPGRIARPYLPPLLAYGSIDGSFPVDACLGDVTVHASVGSMREEFTAVPDAPGHFHIADAPDGQWRIEITAANKRCAVTDYFYLQTGEHRDLSVPPAAPEATSAPAKPGAGAAEPKEIQKENVVWVRGTVRTETGAPVPGASVMALATFQGAIRTYQVTSEAVTDKNGYYEIKGEGGLPSFSATLVASAPGHPPAWAWPNFSKADDKQFFPAVQDLVLPSNSGTLNVTVVRENKAVAGISVAAYLENANLRDIWARPTGSSKQIEDAAYPVIKTGDDGIAHFENLLPGRYRIVATANAPTIRNSLQGIGRLAGLTVQSTGIAVRVNETTNYTVQLYEQHNFASFRAAEPDGTPVTGTAAISFGPSDTIQWNSSEQFDFSGLAKRELDYAGLWQMRAMFRHSSLHTFPIQEPYYLAPGYVAVSPNLHNVNVPAITGLRIEPGSARITVQDVNGDPLRVSVRLSDGFGNDNFSGSTDENGEIVFSGLTSGKKYFIRLSSTSYTDVKNIDLGKFIVQPAGQRVPEYINLATADWNAPLPSPEHMRDEPAILEQTFVAEPNTESRILMRAVPLTYIYGVLHPPKGGRDQRWGVWVDYPLQRLGVRWLAHYATEEYLIGPFPPGEVRLNFGTNTERVVYHATVNVRPNQSGPIRFDIEAEKYPSEVIGASAPPDPIASGPNTVMMGMTGISARAGGAQNLTGKVYLANGHTPALGAQVLYFRAHGKTPALLAMTDALGDLQARGLWHVSNNAMDEADTGPISPTVVAFLPGACGAVVTSEIRAGEPLHLVLPSPVTIAGRVTVAGKSPISRPGVVRVLAASQGRGFLNPYLSVETTADANGNFELAGLTAGDYVVQAALDNIWLSRPVALHVGDRRTKPIRLDIPAPGVAVQLHLRDPLGKPAAGTAVTLERRGPLATLWPREWVSDGTGSVYIPTLEEGRHIIHVSGLSKQVRLKVPRLPAHPMVVRVNIEHAATGLMKIGGAAPYDPMTP